MAKRFLVIQVETSHHQRWIRAALVVGIIYLLIGRLSASPADHVRVWRMAAWILSGATYAAHIWYEHFRLRTSPRSTALHVALGVAIGAFALAAAGMIRSLSTTAPMRPAWLLALLVWPAVTAVPAFLGAFLLAEVLRRSPRSPEAV